MWISLPAWWNYLRVRGEYGFVVRKGRKHVELPPRARRIPKSYAGHMLPGGTTSACAENTHLQSPAGDVVRNYLRVRGEYLAILVRRKLRPELPPRARRILFSSL